MWGVHRAAMQEGAGGGGGLAAAAAGLRSAAIAAAPRLAARRAPVRARFAAVNAAQSRRVVPGAFSGGKSGACRRARAVGAALWQEHWWRPPLINSWAAHEEMIWRSRKRKLPSPPPLPVTAAAAAAAVAAALPSSRPTAG
eukprot:365042-Chlamydomonas_euryale.AAC.47